MADKILIVDDDDDLRTELHDVLDEYEVLEAQSGEEALRILKRANEVVLIILDVKMTGISGLDVLHELKKTDPRIAVIILTGHSSKDVAIEALQNHADDYIEKPIVVSKIKSAVQKLLNRREGNDDINVLDLKGKMEKVKRFVEKNCFKKTGLQEAARTVSLSQKYLSRVFKEHTGVGFSDYRLSVKIEKAKELLCQSGCNVNQISEKLGYENAESFIRQFKKITKSTPAEYRKTITKKTQKKSDSRK
jgi:two-component system, response regulator YesN